MKKNWFKLLLTGILVLSLTACGGSDKTSIQKENDSSEPYTVTMVLNGSQQPDEERIEQKINEILEKECNARLDVIVLPWASAAQQMQLMMSGDEKIDFFYMSGTPVQYLRSGQIVNMSELIDQYGTNLKEVFGEDIVKVNDMDGFVYGIPNQLERGSIPSVFMRKDLIEKYNIDISTIKSPKDMEPIFEIIKAGESDMTMLYSINSGDTPMDRLFGGDTPGNAYGSLMNQTEGTELTNMYASDWYMDTAKMLYSWYQKGYINQDAGTSTENWRTVFKAGNVFSLFYAYHPNTPVEFESSTGYEFEIVTFRDVPIMNSYSYTNILYCIAQNSENPEKAMQVLDYIYGSSEIMNLLNWGEEGVDYIYEDKEKGIINFPEGVTTESVGYSLNLGWQLPNQFIMNLWSGSDPETWTNMEKFNDSAKKSKALGFIFDDSSCENQVAALTNVEAQYKGSINSGSVDPEKYIPEFLAALEAAGVNEVMQEKQRQLDEWLTKQK